MQPALCTQMSNVTFNPKNFKQLSSGVLNSQASSELMSKGLDVDMSLVENSLSKQEESCSLNLIPPYDKKNVN